MDQLPPWLKWPAARTSCIFHKAVMSSSDPTGSLEFIEAHRIERQVLSRCWSALLDGKVDKAALLRRSPRSRNRRVSGKRPQEAEMTDHVYRVTEIVGSSPDGVDAAIRNGIERAARTIRHIDWFEVTQVRGFVEEGQVGYFQVGLKVGFRLEDA
jgi:flavin-binding protein dodecin